MKVQVCTPFIDTGCEWRQRAREWTLNHWQSLGVEVLYGTSRSDPVNRSAARNDAAKDADADVIVFADADTWVRMEQFVVMTELAAQMDRLIHGYVRHVKLSRRNTERVYRGEDIQVGEIILNQPSGIIAVSRKLLDTVGGHDERFVGWGAEDRAFELACRTLAGPGPRVPGDSFHLWHPNAPEKGRGTATRRANIQLATRYKNCAGVAATLGPLPRTTNRRPDPEAMIELLSEPGGPLTHRHRGRIVKPEPVA